MSTLLPRPLSRLLHKCLACLVTWWLNDDGAVRSLPAYDFDLSPDGCKYGTDTILLHLLICFASPLSYLWVMVQLSGLCLEGVSMRYPAVALVDFP